MSRTSKLFGIASTENVRAGQMKALEYENSWIGDVGLVAQATVATLVLLLTVSMLAFGGLVATGLVQLG